MRNFYKILNEEVEATYTQEAVTLLKETPINILPTTLDTATKLAIQANHPQDPMHKYVREWEKEVLGYITACHRCGKYTTEEVINFIETFYHLMRVNYRSKNRYIVTK